MKRDHAQFAQKMSDKDAGEKKSAGDPDQCKKEIDRFPRAGKVGRSDREEIDQNTESQPQEKADQFNHGPDCIAMRRAPSIGNYGVSVASE